MANWISVDERLPKEKVFVVCLLEYENNTGLKPRVGWLKYRTNIQTGNRDSIFIVPHSEEETNELGAWRVLYWMPLPKFPDPKNP